MHHTFIELINLSTWELAHLTFLKLLEIKYSLLFGTLNLNFSFSIYLFLHLIIDSKVQDFRARKHMNWRVEHTQRHANQHTLSLLIIKANPIIKLD